MGVSPQSKPQDTTPGSYATARSELLAGVISAVDLVKLIDSYLRYPSRWHVDDGASFGAWVESIQPGPIVPFTQWTGAVNQVSGFFVETDGHVAKEQALVVLEDVLFSPTTTPPETDDHVAVHITGGYLHLNSIFGRLMTTVGAAGRHVHLKPSQCNKLFELCNTIGTSQNYDLVLRIVFDPKRSLPPDVCASAAPIRVDLELSFHRDHLGFIWFYPVACKVDSE